jgi:hypothetical protein
MGRVIQPSPERAVITMLHHAVGVVPIVSDRSSGSRFGGFLESHLRSRETRNRPRSADCSDRGPDRRRPCSCGRDHRKTTTSYLVARHEPGWRSRNHPRTPAKGLGKSGAIRTSGQLINVDVGAIQVIRRSAIRSTRRTTTHARRSRSCLYQPHPDRPETGEDADEAAYATGTDHDPSCPHHQKLRHADPK